MTELDIANAALVEIGAAPIGSLQDSSINARTVARLLPVCMETVLTEYPWTFALSMATLSLSSFAPPGGYRYAYDFPVGGKYIRRVYADDYKALPFQVYKLQVGTGKAIATYDPVVSCEYTLDIPVDSWPGLVVSALIARLGSDMALQVQGAAGSKQIMYEKYNDIIARAQNLSLMDENFMRNVQQKEGKVHRIDDYISVRWR